MERLESQENNNALSTLKIRKSVTSKAESVKLKEKKNEIFEETEKIDENSLNHKDLESEISHYEKNVYYSDSNNEQNINYFEDAMKHAYKDVKYV